MSPSQPRLGLSLSGGGYRASAFHLGTLNKLNQLGILEKVDILSTISGGSITGAAWCLYRGDYNTFHGEMLTKLKTKSVIKEILTAPSFIIPALLFLLGILGALVLSFTTLHSFSFPLLIITLFILFRYQFKVLPLNKIIENAYDKFFCHKKTLKDLKPKPILAIGSSNLQTGRPFTFSQVKMSDSSYVYRAEYNPPIEFIHEIFPVARAVVASTCVPFAFTPVFIDRQFFKDPERDYHRIKPVLVDGGVYDNQGIQKLTQPGSSYECNIIITSDAGGNFIADKKYPNTFALLLRTVDLFMYRIKTVQMVQHVYRNAQGAAKPIAYFSLGWRLQNIIPGFISNLKNKQVLPSVIAAHQLKDEWVNDPAIFYNEIKEHLVQRTGYNQILKNDLTDDEWNLARKTATSLKGLTDDQLNFLVRHAENLTELQVKLYCPMLLTT